METRWAVPLQDFMTRDLISVEPGVPRSEVQRILDLHGVTAVPVIDKDHRLCGIVSTKDLLRAARTDISTSRSMLLEPRLAASDLMRAPVITIGEGALLKEAAAKMLQHRIHRLIVVRAGDERPIGVITTGDAMRAIALERLATPLSEVMTRDVQTINEDEPVDSAVQRLDDANVRGLVVLDGKWPIGVFTHTEAIRARTLPASMRKIPVERVMSYEMVCLEISRPLGWVAEYARRMRVRRILAVEKHHLRGIASGFDLLRVMVAA